MTASTNAREARPARPFTRKVWCVDGHAVSRRGDGKAPRYLSFLKPLCRLPFSGKGRKRAKLEAPSCPLCITRLRTPGSTWRLRAEARSGESIDVGDAGVFDELVVDDWFHIEQMDARVWWFCVGNGDDVRHFFVNIDRNGGARLNLTEGDATRDRFDALCAAIRKWHRNDDNDGSLFAQVLKLAGVDPREASADEERRAEKGGVRCGPF